MDGQDTLNDELEETVEDVDEEFERMMKDLLLDEQHARAQLTLDEDIRKRLVELHTRADEVLAEAHRRHRLEAKLHMLLETDPAGAAPVMDEYKTLSLSLKSKVRTLKEDLDGHIIPEVGAVLEHTQLSDDQVAHLRQVAMTIKNNLNSATQHITETPPEHYEHLERRVEQSATDDEGNLRPMYER